MTLLLRKEGLFTSLQNLGDHGSQRFGINPRGAMDRSALSVVNVLLGNENSDQALEMHFPAAELLFEKPCRFAVGGADLGARLNGNEIDRWRVLSAVADDVLSFGGKRNGSRAYIAVEGGLLRPAGDNLGAAARFSTIRLVRGERLAFKSGSGAQSKAAEGLWASHSLFPAYNPFPTVRVIEGPEFTRLTEASRRLFRNSDFSLSADSNRMGFRLSGPGLKLDTDQEMVSAAVAFGTIQLLPDGQMIILMADHQTAGGYPRIGCVASVDLPLLGQLGPGDRVAFETVDIETAEALHARFERDLCLLTIGVKLTAPRPGAAVART